MNTTKKYKYINEFLYFVITPDKGSDNNNLVCCSGVNLSRFLPLTKGRHGLGSNPALRGLQLVKRDLRALALERGAIPKTIRRNDCTGIAPTMDNWFTEILLIENAPESFPDEIINFCVSDLLKKIFSACLIELQIPDKLLRPEELQQFLESMCKAHGR